MDKRNERFIQLRKKLGLSQRSLGDSIGLSNSGVSNIENGIRNVTDQHIKLLQSEFNANEDWLRTGEGEMFIENDSTVIAELSTEYKLDAIDQKIIEHYVKLDEQSRQVIKREVVSLAKQIMSLEEIAATSEVDPVEKELDDYRLELEAEKKGETSSAYVDLNEGKESS